MNDTCTCPDCGTELTVEEYGQGLECSKCHCKIDVFPDPDIYVETPVGTLGISFPKKWKGKG